MDFKSRGEGSTDTSQVCRIVPKKKENKEVSRIVNPNNQITLKCELV